MNNPNPTQKKELFNFVCDKCGEKQKPDKKESNKNWEVFPNKKCSCGGTYKLKFK